TAAGADVADPADAAAVLAAANPPTSANALVRETA
ncbi:MAG: hypothetical protein JWO31_1300, partial [Phycisphaerales bacterium]|nr:hypothetical protein [Phycisphaerales bacterium]